MLSKKYTFKVLLNQPPTSILNNELEFSIKEVVITIPGKKFRTHKGSLKRETRRKNNLQSPSPPPPPCWGLNPGPKHATYSKALHSQFKIPT
jgi:hypothetical protein